MRKLVLPLLLVFLAGLSTASVQEVQYEIDAGVDSMEMNTSIAVGCTSFCSGIEWRMPEGGEALGVWNSEGEVDYTVEGRTVDIPGSRSSGRDSETYRIATRVETDAEEIYRGLHKRDISLPSFNGKPTTGFIRNDNLISGKIGYGFETSFSDTEMRFQGEGPTNARIKFGEGGETQYFEFFGTVPDNTQDAYEVPVGTLGIVQGFERFPVSVMEDLDYDKAVNEWSAGEYVGGAIRIRTPESVGETFIPVLGHEVVHGLNDRELTWDQTRSAYFDEGVASYVEFLVQKKLYNQEEIDRPPAELFGDQVRYDPDPTDNRYYTVRSKGDADALWNYYQNDQEYMKTWNAMDSPEDTRSFGYAYSELVIRNYVARMNGSVRDMYRKMDVDQTVEDPEAKWSFYSGFMNMEPCNYDSRRKFDSCLETINDHNYPVYSAQPNRELQQLQINRLEIPNRTETTTPSIGNVNVESADIRAFLQGFLDYILSLLDF